MARRGIIPRMEDLDERTRNPYQPTSNLMNYAPIYGGERRKGYPTGVSAFEDHEGKTGYTHAWRQGCRDYHYYRI